MSTLSGKPRGPIDLSSYVSQRARERQENRQEDRQDNRQEPGREPGQGLEEGSAGDVLRSPYAPKLVRDRDAAAAGAPNEKAAAAEPTIVPSGDPPGHEPDGTAAGALPHQEHDAAPRFPGDAGEEDASAPTSSEFGRLDHLSFATENFEPDHSERGDAAASWHVADAGAQAPIQPDAGEPTDDQMDPMPPAPDLVASLQPGQPKNEPPNRDQGRFSDRDLERLEASLRWLQRQEANVRLPRGPGLGPVSGLGSIEERSGRYGDDMHGRNARLTRSLEPERMAPPPAGARGSGLTGVLALLGLAAVVATGAYYLVAGGSSPAPEPQPERLASVNPTYATPNSRPEPVVTAGQEDEQALARSKIASRFAERLQEQRNLPPPVPAEHALAPVRRSLQAPVQVEPPQVEPQAQPQLQPQAQQQLQPQAQQQPQAQPQLQVQQPQPPAPPTVQAPPQAQPQPQVQARLQPQPSAPEPVAAPPPASAPRIRPLDPETIQILIKKGEQFVAVGDLSGARTVFRRAAEAGDPGAAVALGATYDPIVLQRLGVVGMAAADVEKARTWYQTAENMGSQEATRRLRILANH